MGSSPPFRCQCGALLTMSSRLCSRVQPINLEEERTKFLQDESYQPKFKYKDAAAARAACKCRPYLRAACPASMLRAAGAGGLICTPLCAAPPGCVENAHAHAHAPPHVSGERHLPSDEYLGLAINVLERVRERFGSESRYHEVRAAGAVQRAMCRRGP